MNSDTALDAFTAYLVRNYPGPDTIIGDPKWHAPRIFRAARHAIDSASNPTAAKVERDVRDDERVEILRLGTAWRDRAETVEADNVRLRAALHRVLLEIEADAPAMAYQIAAADIDASIPRPVPDDVAELVIAARIVTFEDQSPEALERLDKASAAFADRVAWNGDPERDAS